LIRFITSRVPPKQVWAGYFVEVPVQEEVVLQTAVLHRRVATASKNALQDQCAGSRSFAGSPARLALVSTCLTCSSQRALRAPSFHACFVVRLPCSYVVKPCEVRDYLGGASSLRIGTSRAPRWYRSARHGEAAREMRRLPLRPISWTGRWVRCPGATAARLRGQEAFDEFGQDRVKPDAGHRHRVPELRGRFCRSERGLAILVDVLPDEVAPTCLSRQLALTNLAEAMQTLSMGGLSGGLISRLIDGARTWQ